MMNEQVELLSMMIKSYKNLYVVGLPGCGKTYNARLALQTQNMPFYRINQLYVFCRRIKCQTKDSLLIHLCKALGQLWESPDLKACKKFSQLALRLQDLTGNESKRGYVVLDLPKLPELEPKYFHRLFKLTQIRSVHSFRILIISNELSQAPELPLAPKIIMKVYNQKQMEGILLANLRKWNEFQVNKNFLEHSQEIFVRDVVQTFTLFTNNLNHLLKISRDLFEEFVLPFLIQKSKDPSNWQGTFNVQTDYTTAKRLLCENPYQEIRSQHFRELIDFNPTESAKKQQREVNKIQAVQTLDSENKIQLALIPSLILLASYYAIKNPEKSDKTIFKDYKKSKHNRKRKTVIEEETVKRKTRTTFYRLIAITQTLMCLSSNDMVNKELKNEKESFSHSVQFYQQIQYLVDQGYLERTAAKDDELSKIKFEPKITEKQAYELAQARGIDFYQYISNQQS